MVTGTALAFLTRLLGRDFCKGRNDEESSDEKLDKGEEEEKSMTFLMNCWLTAYFSFWPPSSESTLLVEPFPFPAMV